MHTKKDTMASLYEHNAEQDQSRAKPKFHRRKNMDRVMSKKMGGGETQNPREGCFMRWNGK